MPPRYSQKELELLLLQFNQEMPLSRLEIKLGRSAYGIIQKIQSLSGQDPDTWNPSKVREYKKQWYHVIGKEYHRQRIAYYKQRLRTYLGEHPDAIVRDLKVAGLMWDLYFGYEGSLDDARRDAGIDKKSAVAKRKEKIITYLKEHPNATTRDLKETELRNAFYSVYRYRIDEARRDAGIITDGYVSGAEAARMLGITRQFVSDLFKRHKLDGYKVGWSLFISLTSVEHRKQYISKP